MFNLHGRTFLMATSSDIARALVKTKGLAKSPSLARSAFRGTWVLGSAVDGKSRIDLRMAETGEFYPGFVMRSANRIPSSLRDCLSLCVCVCVCMCYVRVRLNVCLFSGSRGRSKGWVRMKFGLNYEHWGNNSETIMGHNVGKRRMWLGRKGKWWGKSRTETGIPR